MASSLDCLLRGAADLAADWPLETLEQLADLVTKVSLATARDWRLGFSQQALQALATATDVDAFNFAEKEIFGEVEALLKEVLPALVPDDTMSTRS